MPRPTRTKRYQWSFAEQKLIAAEQQWRCGFCSCILPAAFQCDHRVPLHRGGKHDWRTNGQALCANCHAAKTQLESVARRRR